MFWDLGGVVLSNGWDHQQRAAAARHFQLPAGELEQRHAELAEAFETGRCDLDRYLAAVFFSQPRSFTPAAVWEFMRAQSQPLPGALELLAALRRDRLRVASLNNESRELHQYRVARFGLARHFDFFCASCYLNVRKPSPEIFARALGIADCPPAAALFLDDREENVAAARACGMQALLAASAAALRPQLAERGLLQ